ncbi:MAG: hypothetical protein IJY80_03680, partial [Opitutales bacterium]|nr:hypothetical protein [Opitutales bacterium]
GQLQHAWTTSWGVSTRLIGGMIMTHADDDGMVVPPRLAPQHVVILPIYRDPAQRGEVLAYCEALKKDILAQRYDGRPILVSIDDRDLRGGEKTWGWIKKGIPLRVEVGARDIAEGKVFVGRRDTGEKAAFPRDEFVATLPQKLQEIQDNLLARAKKFRADNMREINTKEEFYEFFTPKNKNKPEVHGGFALCHWNGSAEVEAQIKADLNVTIRCVPLDDTEFPPEPGICPFSGEPSPRRVVFAKSY